MYKKITRTSAQAKMDKEREKAFDSEARRCPECGKKNKDLVISIRLDSYVSTGFLKGEYQSSRVFNYTCRKCGCKWEVSQMM